LWATLLLVGGALAWLSIARYMGYNAGMLDLGNMAQAIWSGTQGEPLVYTKSSGPFSRLSGQFELFYFLFVPFYALWPDPRLLLGGQALLFLLGGIPAYRLAWRATGSRFAARCLTLVYLLYPVAQTAVLFDLHGDTLAMPLLMFALDAYDRRAWRSYVLFIALALSCKFYVAVPVAGIGAYAYLWGQQKRVGALTVAAAVTYGAVVFFVLRPLFHLSADTSGSVVSSSGALAGGYISHYFGKFDELWATLGDRFLNGIIALGPALLVAWRGWRWLLPGLPVAAVVLISTGPGAAYGYSYHHYALVVPFVVMAAIDGTRRMQEQAEQRRQQRQQQPNNQQRRRVGRPWRGDLALTLAIVVLFQALLVDTPLNPFFWAGIPGQGLDHSKYGQIARDRVKDEFLAQSVPPYVTLAASVYLAPHLTNRPTLYTVRYPDDPGGERFPNILPRVDYVLADALFDWRRSVGDGFVGGVTYDRAEIGQALRAPEFDLVAARDGLLLFARDADSETILEQRVERLEGAAPVRLDESAAPELVSASIEPMGERRFRAVFEWQTTAPIDQSYVAVSSLDDVEPSAGARIVHLPTYALYPTEEWQAGERVRETFEVVFPNDVASGSYQWRTGWYNTAHPQAYATDERSLVPDSSVVIRTIEIE
jgi:uncharacterized membrane protein